MRLLQYGDLARFTAQDPQRRHIAQPLAEAGSSAPRRRAAVRAFGRRTDVSVAATRASVTPMKFLSCLGPLMGSRRRVRGARPSGVRDARRVAGWLRGAVRRASASGRLVDRSGLLLRDRVGAVRVELLEIAELLEQAERPDADAVRAVRQLLADGLQSPLFNRDVHPSELLATLYYVRLRLADDAVPRRLNIRELEA
jgi:hypothetical protein